MFDKTVSGRISVVGMGVIAIKAAIEANRFTRELAKSIFTLEMRLT
jgi:hypothetical protein